MKVFVSSAVVALSLVAPMGAWAQAGGTLDKVKASGVITVAYRDSWIPFSYLGADAQPTGFGWEICGRIVEQGRQATGLADPKVATPSVTVENRSPPPAQGP